MEWSTYRRVLANPAVRRAVLLGFLVRMPVFTGSIVLTLHVVSALGHSYAAAGLVTAAATVAIAVSGPWRGKLLDRLGLRRVVAPSIVVALVCWSIAPFVGYWPLLGLAALAGLFVIPTFSVIRQAVIAAVPLADRRTALSLDSVAVELSFMVGPALGIWAATVWRTDWVLFGIQMFGVLMGVILWLVDPPIRSASSDAGDALADVVPRRTWFRPGFVALCGAACASTIVLSGTDIGIVAALRGFDAEAEIGLVLAVWGLGSLLGGVLYGALGRSVPAAWLLGILALVTLPMALAESVGALALLALLAGLLCAPTINATIEQLTSLVPDGARGEALGWHGSAMTGGSALGAPIAGVAIDHGGASGGFLVVAVVGLVVAVGMAGGTVAHRRRPRPA